LSLQTQQTGGEEIELLALLHDPVRRSLYRHVAGQRDYVSRDEAAAAVGIARALAAHHLDRMAAGGLLETTYRRPPGRGGPGAGRPAKLYRRSRRQIAVSLPHRDYELLARLLAAALDQDLPERVSGRLAQAAGRAGTALAAQARRLAGRGPGRRRLVDAAMEALSRQGYEPRRDGADLQLVNCPFEAVAQEHRGLVCRVNLALLEAFARGLDLDGVTLQAEPGDGRCCVVIRTGAGTEAAPA